MTRAAEPPDAVLRYAGHSDALVDVFLPVSLGRPEHHSPLVLFVHGGFWRAEYDRMHVRPLAGALRRRGFVVAVPEYRRVGGAGGWPQTADDVEAALAAVPGMLGDVAPGYVDPVGLPVLAGHSAGGHLALWAGLRAGSRRVAAIVALAPVTDLAHAARVRMGDGAVQELLGGESRDLPDRYADADVVSMLPSAESRLHSADDASSDFHRRRSRRGPRRPGPRSPGAAVDRWSCRLQMHPRALACVRQSPP